MINKNLWIVLLMSTAQCTMAIGPSEPRFPEIGDVVTPQQVEFNQRFFYQGELVAIKIGKTLCVGELVKAHPIIVELRYGQGEHRERVEATGLELHQLGRLTRNPPPHDMLKMRALQSR